MTEQLTRPPLAIETDKGEERLGLWSGGSVAVEPTQLSEEPLNAALPIGQLLIEAELIGETDLARALAFQERYGGRLGSILVREL